MTTEQQRIAIAEACGWRLITNNPNYHPYWEDPKGNMIGACFGLRFPDYLNDLNAMHEAEKILFPTFEIEWHCQLQNVCGCSWRVMIRASASQRAEAFLRTIGKWKES